MRQLIFTVTITSCMLMFVGCGGRNLPKDLPPLYRQSIVITQDGEPFANVSVGVIPVDESKWNAAGATDANGVAEMYTHGLYRGVAAGKHKVTLSKQMTETKFLGFKRDGEEVVEETVYSPFALKYLDSKTTPLEIEVSKKNAKVTFDVGPAVRVVIPRDQ